MNIGSNKKDFPAVKSVLLRNFYIRARVRPYIRDNLRSIRCPSSLFVGITSSSQTSQLNPAFGKTKDQLATQPKENRDLPTDLYPSTGCKAESVHYDAETKPQPRIMCSRKNSRTITTMATNSLRFMLTVLIANSKFTISLCYSCTGDLEMQCVVKHSSFYAFSVV